MAAQHKPCLAYGSEIGQMDPFIRKTAERLCKDVYFITRTEPSQKALEALGLTGHTGTDTAWRFMPKISDHSVLKRLTDAGWDGVQPLVGATVINPFCWPVRASFLRWFRSLLTNDHSGQYDTVYFFSDSPERKEAFRRYIGEMAEAVSRFCRDTGAFPVVIGMEKLDAEACALMQETLNIPSALFTAGEYSADIMTGMLRKLSYLVTSRYHASVLSIPGGVPIIAVSMDERLDSIMQEMDLAENYLHHIDDSGLSEKILHSLQRASTEKETISLHLQEYLHHYQTRMDEMGIFLKDYLDRNLLQQR